MLPSPYQSLNLSLTKNKSTGNSFSAVECYVCCTKIWEKEIDLSGNNETVSILKRSICTVHLWYKRRGTKKSVKREKREINESEKTR